MDLSAVPDAIRLNHFNSLLKFSHEWRNGLKQEEEEEGTHEILEVPMGNQMKTPWVFPLYCSQRNITVHRKCRIMSPTDMG
jgi:hypothetical protein